MHIYTLVITRGPRRSAITRAYELLRTAVPTYVDRAAVGGRYADRLGKHRDEIDAWHAAMDRRYQQSDADRTDADDAASVFADPLVGPELSEVEQAQQRRVAYLANDAMIELTSKLPWPLPESVVPAAIITPEGRWRVRPVAWKQGDPRWSRWVDATIDRYRGGHCVVVADCHC